MIDEMGQLLVSPASSLCRLLGKQNREPGPKPGPDLDPVPETGPGARLARQPSLGMIKMNL